MNDNTEIYEFIASIGKGPFKSLKMHHTGKDSDFLIRENDKTIFRCAVDQAWLDACRTFEKIKKNNKEKIICMVAGQLEKYFSSNLRKIQDVFDCWHEEAISAAFVHSFNWKYGQGQKVLNMAFKYLFCCRDFREEKKEYFKFCHMPLDTYTLAWYQRRSADKTKLVWSKLDYDKYIKIQNEVRNYIDKNQTALEAEFKVWPNEKRIALLEEVVKDLESLGYPYDKYKKEIDALKKNI